MVTIVVLSAVSFILFLWVIVLAWWLKISMERELELTNRNYMQEAEIEHMKTKSRVRELSGRNKE